jgi:RHS repeat-associated protein
VSTLTYNGGETVTYAYDAGGRPTQVCSDLASTPCYASGAKYTALDQPKVWTFGNDLEQTWTYETNTARLDTLQVGPSADPDLLVNRNYGYDLSDNIVSIQDGLSAANSQVLGYDALDRLDCWQLNAAACTQTTYSYDKIGNLLSKPGNGTYGYAAQSARCSAGALDKAHAVVSISTTTFCYDRNGTMVSGGGRTYSWNGDNLPMAISHVSGTEFYVYDGDGERVAKSNGSVDTIYVAGLLEQVVGGVTKTYYTFGDQTVAMRDSGTGLVTYLHADHLGSVSLATWKDSNDVLQASQQEFDPWGKVRSGGVSQTSLNYTSQRLDGTGLLYYHARNYDPVLARFVSADSVVPGNASGSMDGVALKPLTVDFHEPGSVSTLSQENSQPFWFQMSDRQRQQAGSPWGPANAQALNRYSYGLNNPVKYTDPTGHCVEVVSCTLEGAAVGSVVPGAGTAAGAVVGFLIGAAITIGVGAGVVVGMRMMW